MCGILGVRRSWHPQRDAVASALDALAWRGPDGSRLIEVGDWFLGTARLAITDPDAAQPLVCKETGRAVAFNGAVTSATAEWRAFGELAETRNDAELLLLRLRAEGPRALGAMSGPHAFAVVDPAAETLWLGRDPEGEKPLFVVRERGRTVAFASSAAALWRLGIEPRWSDAARAVFLRYGFAPRSLLRVRDHDLRADLHGVFEERPRGTLEAIASALPPAPAGADPADLGSVVAGAVERCATAAVPLGTCLSGGVDSACIAACLADLGRSPPAYQFRADGEPAAERGRARLVAHAFGLELREVGGGPEILRALPGLTAHAGEPLGDPSVLAVHALARAAAADGVRVLLSGEGADDLLLGYPRHTAARWLPRRGIGWLPRSRLGTGRAARLSRALSAARPYDALLEVAPPAFRSAALAPELAAAGELPDGLPDGTALERARAVDRRQYLRADLLPKLDTALMAAGVEGRCPFLDPAVLCSDAVAEPDARRVVGKRALRRAFRDRLPPEVLAQRKLGFAVPIDRWLRDDDFLGDVLTDRRTLERPHVRKAGLRRMFDLHRNGRAALGLALYALVALELFDRAREGAVRCG